MVNRSTGGMTATGREMAKAISSGASSLIGGSFGSGFMELLMYFKGLGKQAEEEKEVEK